MSYLTDKIKSMVLLLTSPANVFADDIMYRQAIDNVLEILDEESELINEDQDEEDYDEEDNCMYCGMDYNDYQIEEALRKEGL